MSVQRYKDIQRAVLERIGQSTIAGEGVSPAYNGQEDTLRRIPHLLNTALTDIRTSVGPRRASFTARRGEPLGKGLKQYRLPKDCFRILSGGVRRLTGHGLEPTNRYTLLGDNTICLPADGEFVIEYLCAAPEIPPDARNFPEYSFEEDSEVINCAILYVAAQLVMEENEFLYAALNNEYEGRLGRLRPNITAEVHPVKDAMGGVW